MATDDDDDGKDDDDDDDDDSDDRTRWSPLAHFACAVIRTQSIVPAGAAYKPSSPTAVFPASDRRRQRSTLG